MSEPRDPDSARSTGETRSGAGDRPASDLDTRRLVQTETHQDSELSSEKNSEKDTERDEISQASVYETLEFPDELNEQGPSGRQPTGIGPERSEEGFQPPVGPTGTMAIALSDDGSEIPGLTNRETIDLSVTADPSSPRGGFAAGSADADSSSDKTMESAFGFTGSNSGRPTPGSRTGSLPPSGSGGNAVPPPERPDAAGSGLPARVGKFLIKGELGRGAFGVVYLGYDEELQRNVAIKVSLVSDPKRQAKLKVEASKAAQVESTGIVPVYHIGTTDDGSVYFVQKYIPGCSLRDVIKQNPLSPARATALVRELAIALSPAHQQDILHRDLKPDNVLIDEQGRAWIADFGLAISESEQANQGRELAGTPPYMSPEQIQGRVDFMDARSDIWALGVIYYELLTGKLPFLGKTRKTITEQICERDPRPLQQHAPGLMTDSINQVFLKACAKKPSDRYATMLNFAEALEDLLAEGLSDQNVNGETTDAWFGKSTVDYLSLRSRSRSLSSGSTHGSMRSSTGSVRSDSMLLSGESKPASATKSLLKNSLALLGIIVLSIAASVGYQRFGASATDTLAAASTTGKSDGSDPLSATGQGGEGAQLPIEAALDAINSGSGAGGSSPGEAGAMPELEPPPPLPAGTADDPMVVAADGSGSHSTLAAALADTPEDGWINVMGGIYQESLSIKRAVTIVGVARTEKGLASQIENGLNSTFLIEDVSGTVQLRNLKIAGKGTSITNEFNAMEVVGSRLELIGCDVTTSSFNGVKLRAGATLLGQECNFFDSRRFAVSGMEHEDVELVDCKFLGSGVELTDGPGTIRHCNFFGAQGIWCQGESTKVVISDCVMSKSREESVAAFEKADVSLAKTTFEDCEIALSILTGAVAKVSEQCEFVRCNVPILVSSGQLSVTDSQLTDTQFSGIQIKGDSTVRLTRVAIDQAKKHGIDQFSGSLVMTNCQVRDCGQGGLMFGQTDLAGLPPLSVEVSQCTLKNDAVNLKAEGGSLKVIESVFQGAGSIGLYLSGSDENPMDVTLENTTEFSRELVLNLFAQGTVKMTIDKPTEKAVEPKYKAVGGKVTILP